MKKYLTFLLVPACLSLQAQRVGINTSTPEAALDVYGDLILRSADIVVADGITLALDVNSNRFSYYRIGGPTAAFTIAGISAATEGRLITLFNRSGFTMELPDEDATAAAIDRIITGTNGSLSIPQKGIVNLQYDGLEQRWVVLSNNKINGAAVSGGWGLNGNSGNTVANFIGNTDNVPLLIKSGNNTLGNFNNNNVSIGLNAGDGFVQYLPG